MEKIIRVTHTGLQKKFVLETNASNVGLGAVLKQENTPVAYISRLLKDAELNYSALEKEVLAVLWACEKLEFYLLGREFTLVTDSKAITEINRKEIFGSAKIQRWHERIQRFQFKVVYRPGIHNTQADAFSREISPQEAEINNMLVDKEEVLKFHENSGHRKSIRLDLKKKGIKITETDLKDTIDDCIICAMKDKKRYCKKGFIPTYFPGELVGIDILELERGKKVILAIDYFTRKIFGAAIKTKDGKSVRDFLMNVQTELEIKTLISDTGREFCNRYLERWCKNNNISHKLSVPYRHESNGRIERANRTIRAALKKTKGSLKEKLKRVLQSYNEMYHRGTGISPNEALKESNRESIIEHQKKVCFRIWKPKRRQNS